jgi:hypothetical protein
MPRITPIALAIREALDLLGRKASTADVKEKVLELHPDLEDEVNDARFGPRVRQNRSKKYGGTAVAAAAPAPSTPKLTLLDKYELADQFFCLCGSNHKHAQEVLAFLEQVPPDELNTALAAWERLMQTAGGIEKARAILETMRQGGLG